MAVLPDSMNTLSEMELFHMRENELRELGPEIRGWGEVLEIDVAWNKLHRIDEAVGNLTNLQVSIRLPCVSRVFFCGLTRLAIAPVLSTPSPGF